MPDQPSFRLARAVVFATVCLTLTTAGHAYAAHAAVPAGTVGLGFLLVTGLAALLAGTERSFRTILGGLLGAQFGLHVMFTQATAGSAHHTTGAPADPPAGGGTAMTLAHLAAALVAAWWLRRGEAAMWSLARRIAAATGAPWRSPAVPAALDIPSQPRFRPSGPERLSSPAPLRHTVVRRGPPARLSTTAL